MTAIRAMTAADAAPVAALLSASWARTYAPILGEARVAAASAALHAPQELAAESADQAVVSLVAVNDAGGLLGYAMAFVRDDGEAWLERLHVEPAAFGTGLAATLLDRIEAAFPAARSIALDVIVGNNRAIAFYRKHGFAVAESKATCGSLDDAPAIVMRKRLRG